MGDKREGNKYEEHAFHSSVNRIPRLPDYARNNDRANYEAIYREGIQTHLDYLHAGRLSGYFDLQLTAHSPLLIGEQTEEEGIHYLQVQEVAGKPFIAPTMIKGLLSTTYERVTSSRFRIFDTSTHVKSLTYRTDPSQSLSLTPVRYTGETDTNENLRFEILDSSPSGDNKPAYLPIKYNKKVLGNRYKLNNAYTKEFIKRFRHGDHVRFEAYRIKRRWIVTTISKIDDTRPLHVGEFQNNKGDRNPQTPIRFTGYLYTTSPKDNISANKTNFSKKWAERIFIEGDVTEENVKSRFATCDQSTIARYHAVLDSYAEHQEAADKLQERRNRPKVTNNIFSRMTADERTLKKGDLAYALLDTKDRIKELVPITVGRHAYSHAPNTLAEADGVNPARTLTEASAADRLFGFVGNDSESGTSLRGRVQIGPVSTSNCSTAVPPEGQAYVTLPPLLSPKPSSGRRFLVSRKDFPNPTNNSKHTGTWSKQSDDTRANLFNPSTSSLGEAAYPTHRLAIGKNLDAIITEYDRSRDTTKDSDSVRLRVRSWLKTGSSLSCRVTFEDLSPKELAFLLWPLIPQNLSPVGSSEIGYHKLGIGKPLGLGLVEVNIDDELVHFPELPDIAEGYSKLTTVLGSESKSKKAPELLSDTKIGDLTRLPSIRAFQRIAYGFKDNESASNGDDKAVPVRYISLDENKVNNATKRNGNPLFFRMHRCHAGRAPQALWVQTGSEQPDVFLAEKKSDHDESNDRSRTRDDKARAEADKSEGHKNKRDKRSGSHTEQDGVYSGKSQRDTSGEPRKRGRRRRSRKH